MMRRVNERRHRSDSLQAVRCSVPLRREWLRLRIWHVVYMF